MPIRPKPAGSRRRPPCPKREAVLWPPRAWPASDPQAQLDVARKLANAGSSRDCDEGKNQVEKEGMIDTRKRNKARKKTGKTFPHSRRNAQKSTSYKKSTIPLTFPWRRPGSDREQNAPHVATFEKRLRSERVFRR